ncbi:putative protein phosphatase 2C 66 [Iris pallida]|uniref:protein-serine/threonine phosphatase n=1 Tax=Iris pallida TaxID=29817 RepID=A0AAX6E8W7_IRIPA|nr:putative protein phosphatase 2C 66 [Iris pallida]
MGSCVSSHNHTRTRTHSPVSASAAGPTTATTTVPSSCSSRSSIWKEKRTKRTRRERAAKDPNPIGREEELHRVPGRMFVNGSSSAACLFTQQGKKGTNQDAMLVWENFTLRSDTIFCGVFDGHGPLGHLVARKVRDSLPLKLCTQWKANASGEDCSHQNGSASGSMNSEERASINIDEDMCEPLDVGQDVKLPEMYPILKQSLLKAFKLMDNELKLHPGIDCFCSGTTAVTVVKQGQDLVIGNVGDSRGILGTRDRDNNLVAVQLTVDLKPNLPKEAARIHQCRGRVFALQDEPEVARVWLPNSDSPGLAMARAFGDFCLKDYGLISVPDISYRRLTEKDEFIVLATDGVWDVFSNKEVVDIIASAPTRATAARALVESAVRAWRLKFPTSKSDDCAVVCLYFDPPSSPYQAQGDSVKAPEGPKETMVSSLTDEQETSKIEERDESVASGVQTYNPSFEHSCGFHATDDEIVPLSEEPATEKLTGRSQSRRSLADCISTTEEEEWSALEGVTRANSLLNIPRFLSGDRKSTSRRKWL